MMDFSLMMMAWSQTWCCTTRTTQRLVMKPSVFSMKSMI